MNQTSLQKAANDYSKAGFAVLPINSKKQPALDTWKEFETVKPTPEQTDFWFGGNLSKMTGLAIITGEISGNLEVVDVDCKYDLTGSLMKDFCDLLKEHLPELFPKFVIAKTVNGGYHIIYRTIEKTVEGNKKLAFRPPTTEEKANGKKKRDLIETRAEGGYIAAAPTTGYKWVQGSPDAIPTITAQEREMIMTIARSFDQMPIEQSEPERAAQKAVSPTRTTGDLSTFEDFNQRADVPSLLERHGWKLHQRNGSRLIYTRPGKTDQKASANWDESRRLFYVFTTSSDFQSDKGYNPSQVFAHLEHSGDLSSAAKRLYADGYGARYQPTTKNAPPVLTEAPPADQIIFDAAPVPLPQRSKAAPPLDERLLPASWREWLADIADRLQCPLEFPTVAAMVAASALIGNKIRIRPKQRDIWQVTPNLWGAVVGVPSMLKSPAVKEGMFFFREIENEQRTAFERELKDVSFEKEFAEAKQGELKKKMRDKNASKEDLKIQFESLQIEEPKERRLSTSDATVEKLSELLNENENGILQIRDELTGWFRGLERAGREGDRAFYLECWDGGESTKIDRIARGSLTVKNLTLSILGTIQPAMLEPYLRGALEGTGDDGLIQRFQMLVYPNKPIDYRFTDRTPKGREQARKSFRGLFELEPSAFGAKQLAEEFGGGYFVQFDNDAQAFFQQWLTELETDLRSEAFESSAFESHVAKYRSLMPSLALIFHLLDCVIGDQKSDVSLENAQRAAAWCGFLQAHAERIYQIAELSEFDVAREILKKINAKDLTNEFTARDIYGKHWAKLSKPQDVRSGLETLTEYGYLQAVTINDGHRPKKVYFIHPELI